jgi:hypothetical protein
MTPGKLAAQCVHVSAALNHTDNMMSVVVLEVNDTKFNKMILEAREPKYCHIDHGLTEPTVLGYYENE